MSVCQHILNEMRIRSLLLPFAVTLSLLLSCKENPDLEVREIDYINKSEKLIKAVPVDVQLPLVVYCTISCDNLNIVLGEDPKGYVFVYSDDWKLLDVFCHQGRARNEFLQRPGMIKKQVFKDANGHLQLPLQDEASIKVLDITESLNTHRPVISQIRDFLPYDYTPVRVDQYEVQLQTDLQYLFLDNDIYHTLELTQGFNFLDDKAKCVAKYSIRHDTTFMDVPQVLVKMQDMAGPQPESKFGREFFKHPNKNLIIETFYLLDYIMFYDLDKDRSFAIHQTGYPTFLDDPEIIPHYNEKGEHDYDVEARACFGQALTTDSYFLVFFYGGDYSLSDENKDYPQPELLLFDWDGNFKKSVKLDTYIDAATFDQEKKILYGVPIGQEEETLLSFDLSHLFD